MRKDNHIKEEIEKQKLYEEEQKKIKAEIKATPHHFWRLMWHYFKKPFVWIIHNIKDWRTAVIFLIVMLVVGCEVWIPLLLGLLAWGTPFGATMLGIAGTCEAFWLMPMTPFLPLCIGLTAVVKGIFNKIRFRRFEKKEKQDEQQKDRK